MHLVLSSPSLQPRYNTVYKGRVILMHAPVIGWKHGSISIYKPRCCDNTHARAHALTHTHTVTHMQHTNITSTLQIFTTLSAAPILTKLVAMRTLWSLTSITTKTVIDWWWCTSGWGAVIWMPAHWLLVYRCVSISANWLMNKRYVGTIASCGGSIWRHGSASILGTTRTDTRAPMLMYWAGLSRIASPRERRPK